jgi:lipoprotein-anchoring transpeptidase ErfK/SrfK
VKGIVFAAVAAACFTACPALANPARPPATYSASLTTDDAAALEPGSYVWRDGGSGGPLSIVVSLPDQRAYVYRGPVLVAASTVSTGREGRDTPVGSFPILQKEAVHKSSLYDDAPMPFMQRLTWDGVALHAGANPGFPSSHGCVHLPTAFARKLFAATRIGTSVTVVDASVDGSPVPRSAAELSMATATETADANDRQLAATDRP